MYSATWLIIATDTFEEYQKWLEIVLTKIRDAQLTVNWKKCEFGCSRVRYLGYLLDREGLRPDPERIEPILSAKDQKAAAPISGNGGVLLEIH